MAKILPTTPLDGGYGRLVDLPHAAPKSYKPEVIADSTGKWYGNALRFRTREEAEKNVKDLQERWLLVTDTRVSESEDEPTHAWTEVGLVRLDGAE